MKYEINFSKELKKEKEKNEDFVVVWGLLNGWHQLEVCF